MRPQDALELYRRQGEAQISAAGTESTPAPPTTTLPAGSIALPKGVPVTLDVDIQPTTPGSHSAILNLDDPSTAGIDYQHAYLETVLRDAAVPASSVKERMDFSDAKALGKASVTVEVLGATKGPKIIIQKYKNKTGYKKRQGHRQKYTQVKVTDISL